MTLPEWVALANFHQEAQRRATGSLSEDQVDELLDWVYNDATSSQDPV